MPASRGSATTRAARRAAAATTAPPAPRRLLDPVAAWHVAQRAARRAAAGERRGRPHRLQDRHLLRLSRCLGGRLRRQAHHRRLGRPARRRAGARPRRPHGRGADPVRCFRPHRANCRRRCRRRRTARFSRPPAICRRRCSVSVPGACGAGRASRRCASCFRRTARGSSSPAADGKLDPVALKIVGRHRAAHRAGQRRAAPRDRPAHAVLRAGRARLRAAHRDRRARRADSVWCGCSDRHWRVIRCGRTEPRDARRSRAARRDAPEPNRDAFRGRSISLVLGIIDK